ncbi:MAG: class II glutamine amidotransferase [Thermodesulfobacteriota bacterium]
MSELITEPVHSIIHQSFHSHERKEPLNGDGFGLAWYVPSLSKEPAIFKDITPAWNNINLLSLAGVTESGCVLAHVRAATVGFPVVQLNCHPFSYGPFSFVHNGKVGGFKRVRRALLGRLSDEAFSSIKGSTDSEHVFALFMDNYRKYQKVNPDGTPERADGMATALLTTIAQIEELTEEAGIEERSVLNVAVTDGTSAVVSRYINRDPADAATLYIHSDGCFSCVDGEFTVKEARADSRAVIVASEPLNTSDGWRAVEANSMVILREDLTVSTRKIGETLAP